MSFNPQALSERTLKQFVDRLHQLRKSQPCPTEKVWPPKRSAIQEEIAQILGFTSWHHAIHAVRPTQPPDPAQPQTAHDSQLYPNEPLHWTPNDLDDFLSWSVARGSSDIVFQSQEEGVYLEIYGKRVRASRCTPTFDEMLNLIEYMYGSETCRAILTNNKDIEFVYQSPKRERFRVDAVPVWVNGRQGISLNLHTIPTTPPQLTTVFEDMPPQLYSALFHTNQGLVIVGGATGQGKSTLLASIVREMLTTQENKTVVSYESPVEFDYFTTKKNNSNLVSQVDLHRMGMTVGQAVNKSMRRGHGNIVLGSVRDVEGLSEAVTAALVGHKVFMGVHSENVANVIRRIVSAHEVSDRPSCFVDLISATRAIVCTRLYPTTNGTRVALHEHLSFSDDIVDRIVDSGMENFAPVVEKILQEQESSFSHDAQRKFNSGIISKKTLKEVQRGYR